jgi:Eukaryotic aspartyl protease
MHLSLQLLAVFSGFLRFSAAAPGQFAQSKHLSDLGFIKTYTLDWVSLTLSGPNAISDQTIDWYYYVNNVLIGTPPATESLVLDISSGALAVSSDDCVFCAGGTLFDPTLSSTYKVCGFDAYSFLDHLESCR